LEEQSWPSDESIHLQPMWPGIDSGIHSIIYVGYIYWLYTLLQEDFFLLWKTNTSFIWNHYYLNISIIIVNIIIMIIIIKITIIIIIIIIINIIIIITCEIHVSQ